MTYLRNIVICTFRALHPDDLVVPDDRLEEFDKSLRNTFDHEVRQQADDKGIDKSVFNLSMIVCFSALSTSEAVTSQVEDGCDFFVSVNPVP